MATYNTSRSPYGSSVILSEDRFMINSEMFMLAVIILLSILFFKLTFEILSPYHEEIFIYFTRKGKRELKFVVDFVKGLGPNISKE